MPAYLRAFSRRLDLAAQGLAPAYFALVMATGVLSLSSDTFGLPLLARYLFGLNIVFYAVLWVLTLWRSLYFPQRLWNDLLNYQRGPGFFSIVAASSVLGSQCILLVQYRDIALVLWIFGAVLWFLLNYGIFTLYTIRLDKPRLENGISGIWLLAVVAVQSLAVLALQLDGSWSALHRLEYNFVALSLWLWGGMLYIWIMVLIFYRYIFFAFMQKISLRRIGSTWVPWLFLLWLDHCS
ncbi:tellurite resistance/C4-dicarboxylate transporter family protein [Acidithiobacillus sp. YTS05]|nr:tellurite resistance/C4-dicarboxylate transporter family protein [Acidithiobacillus sp. YTS05]